MISLNLFSPPQRTIQTVGSYQVALFNLVKRLPQRFEKDTRTANGDGWGSLEDADADAPRPATEGLFEDTRWRAARARCFRVAVRDGADAPP
jgi:hypothetical protein